MRSLIAFPSAGETLAGTLDTAPGATGLLIVSGGNELRMGAHRGMAMLAAVEEYSGWGYFDYRQIREPFEDGYQSLPVDWGINSPRKKGFFSLLAQVTGAAPL